MSKLLVVYDLNNLLAANCYLVLVARQNKWKRHMQKAERKKEADDEWDLLVSDRGRELSGVNCE